MNVYDNGITIELETREEREMMIAIVEAATPDILDDHLFRQQKGVPYRRQTIDFRKLVLEMLE
jgi:hypothetical protein